MHEFQETTRKLATVDVISDLKPIDGAAAIECATVRGWHVVVKKGEFHIGDPCVYVEVDSLLPIDNPHFAFLSKSGSEAPMVRLRTARFRGQISQGIVFPTHILNGDPWSVGHDVTSSLGITKYDPEEPAVLRGIKKRTFPSFIPRTDEERVQNLTWKLPLYADAEFYATEKLDGTSATFYIKDGTFGVCSRNMELQETDDNLYWTIARSNKIEENMRSVGINFAIQGEIIGPGVQKNRLRRMTHELYVHRVFNIQSGEIFGFDAAEEICRRLELRSVPLIRRGRIEYMSVDALVAFATRNSILKHDVKAEGVVFRTVACDFSFKAINPEYLLKHGE